MPELPKDIEKYWDALIKAWEQYLKIIDILIALLGATVLILVNLFKEIGAEKLRSVHGTWLLIFLGLTILFITLWRLASQHFFEYETVGSPDLSRRYFSHQGIEAPFTRAFVPQAKLRTFYRTIFPFVAYGSGICLGATWFLLVALAVA
jgi:hypothetical protein